MPAPQFAQPVQEAALAMVLNVPSGHTAHVLSVVAVASARICVPGAHALTGMQTVAGLPSPSHVPAPQDVAELVPPAQY